MKLDKHNKAWNILTEEEKTALSLQFSFDKSTWQAGEIMGKAHYKYLEIKARAEKFLKMFTEHFKLFQGLIPKGVYLDDRFKEYMDLVIYKRSTSYEAIELIDDKEFSLTSSRELLIIEQFENLKNYQTYAAQSLLNIILDFDRWNNFRILPKALQEPSAYKRRNKNRLKKQIKNVVNLNPFILEKVIEKFSTDKVGVNIGNLPLVLERGKRYKIIQVDLTREDHISQINRIGLFLFKDPDKTLEFAELLISFDINKSKDCKQGLLFWPKYRVLIQGAINYTEIENIIPSRKYLEGILNDWDIMMYRHSKKVKDPK